MMLSDELGFLVNIRAKTTFPRVSKETVLTAQNAGLPWGHLCGETIPVAP